MRHHPRLDANQTAIVEALRKAGHSVRSLAAVGNGCPDLLVGTAGRNLLMEVKDGAKPPSARKLTPDEEAFARDWRGQVVTVESVEQALRVALEASVLA